MVLGHIIKASSRFISPGSKINASKAIDIAHGLTRTTLKKPGGRKRGSMYKMPGETIREEGGGISRTSNGRTTYSPGKLSDSEISKLKIQAKDMLMKRKVTAQKRRSVGTYYPSGKLSDSEISKLRIKVNNMINKKISAKDKVKKSIRKSDILRIIKNKLPVKQRPIKTKTDKKSDFYMDTQGDLRLKRKSNKPIGQNSLTRQMKHRSESELQYDGIIPFSRVERSTASRKLGAPKRSSFEINQSNKQISKEGVSINKGATYWKKSSDGKSKFRNVLDYRTGEQSINRKNAEKWTGVGLGVTGGGTIAWDQRKNKFPDPLKFG